MGFGLQRLGLRWCPRTLHDGMQPSFNSNIHTIEGILFKCILRLYIYLYINKYLIHILHTHTETHMYIHINHVYLTFIVATVCLYPTSRPSSGIFSSKILPPDLAALQDTLMTLPAVPNVNHHPEAPQVAWRLEPETLAGVWYPIGFGS